MANRVLATPSRRLFQDAELDNVIRESEPLLLHVLNEDDEWDNVIRGSEPLLMQVRNEDDEQDNVIIESEPLLMQVLKEDAERGNVIRGSEPLLMQVLNEDTELGNVNEDKEPGNIIWDSELLLMQVLNEERELVIVDNNTRVVRDADVEKALTRVSDTADISDLVSIVGYEDIDRRPGTSGEYDDNDGNDLAYISDDQQLFGFCMYCSRYKRAHTYDQLNRGDSIRFPRLNGLYYHHATVKKVEKGFNSSCCILTLIHLQKTGIPLFAKVIEEPKTYDLRKEIVEKVIYESNPFTPDEIVRRAEEYAAQNTTPHVYDVFRNNCEHLCNEFAQNVKISPQVGEKLIPGISWILNTLYKIGSSMLRMPELNTLANISLLIMDILKMRNLKKMLRDKRVCFRCYDKEYKKLKISLVMGVISFAVSVIDHFNWPRLTIGLIISTALPFCVPLVHKHIMLLIQPEYLIPKQTLSIKNIPRTGDIITFYYHNLPHEGVVSKVHGKGSGITGLNATIIHFPWPGLFGTYTVTEETIYFNQIDDVSVLDFEGTHHLPASVVVWKARKELGKQNHNHSTYRSSHLSRYCKTGNKSLNTLPTVSVRCMYDLSPGDVIRFRYCGLPHEAVLIRIAEAEHIRIDVIHYNYAGMFGTRKVVNEEMAFKLSDENVHIHDYANVEVYEPEEVVRRAESRVGEQKFNMFTNRSSHLAKWCKIKQN